MVLVLTAVFLHGESFLHTSLHVHTVVPFRIENKSYFLWCSFVFDAILFDFSQYTHCLWLEGRRCQVPSSVSLHLFLLRQGLCLNLRLEASKTWQFLSSSLSAGACGGAQFIMWDLNTGPRDCRASFIYHWDILRPTNAIVFTPQVAESGPQPITCDSVSLLVFLVFDLADFEFVILLPRLPE